MAKTGVFLPHTRKSLLALSKIPLRGVHVGLHHLRHRWNLSRQKMPSYGFNLQRKFFLFRPDAARRGSAGRRNDRFRPTWPLSLRLSRCVRS